MTLKSLKIGALIQARMSSRRLPNKVLLPLSGKPVLEYILDALTHSRSLQSFAVVTSTMPEDDRLAEYCAQAKVTCFRGPLDDVYRRFAQALAQLPWDGFVRVCGDSPLMDPNSIDQAIQLLQQRAGDIITNAFPRSFPKGRTIEATLRSFFLEQEPKMESKDYREHIFSYFYEHSKNYHIHNFSLPENYSSWNLCVDTSEDLRYLEKLFAKMTKRPWEYTVEELKKLDSQLESPRG